VQVKYDGKLFAILELFPSAILIDRKPVEDEFGRLVEPPHRRGPDIDLHSSPIRDLFAFALVPPKGESIDEDRLADIMLKRNAEEASPLHQLLEIPVDPTDSEINDEV
jgi:hypothetical protein